MHRATLLSKDAAAEVGDCYKRLSGIRGVPAELLSLHGILPLNSVAALALYEDSSAPRNSSNLALLISLPRYLVRK